MIDASTILKQLATHGVEYAIVGGLAAAIYGNNRATFDIDLVIAVSKENLGRFANAINPLNPRLRPNGPTIVLDDKPLGGRFSRIYTDHGVIDVFTELPGVPTAQLLYNAVSTSFGDVSIRVASLDDLIAMKEAANRDHDRTDAENLRFIRDQFGVNPD